MSPSPKPLKNIEVESFLETLLPSTWFFGVFPVDKIPWEKCRKDNEWGLCINLDPSTEPGSHFIALTKNMNGIFLYDSLNHPYGTLPAKFRKSLESLVKIGDVSHVWTITRSHQPLSSNTCGYYTIHFLLSFYYMKKTWKGEQLTAYYKDMSNEKNKENNENKVLVEIVDILKLMSMGK